MCEANLLLTLGTHQSGVLVGIPASRDITSQGLFNPLSLLFVIQQVAFTSTEDVCIYDRVRHAVERDTHVLVTNGALGHCVLVLDLEIALVVLVLEVVCAEGTLTFVTVTGKIVLAPT